jgi:transcriptional/translational regulatory protein YebC/TACO1
MGSAGCAANQFDRKGLFAVDARAVDEDTLMGIVLDAGADDLKKSGDHFEVTCEAAQFNKVQEALKASNVTPTTAEVTQLPKVPMDVDVETGQKVLRLMEALEDHDDVQHAYSSLHLTDELLAAVEKE